MFGHLADVVVVATPPPPPQGDPIFTYREEVPIAYAPLAMDHWCRADAPTGARCGYLTVTFQYGERRPGRDPFGEERTGSRWWGTQGRERRGEDSHFIHPVLRVFAEGGGLANCKPGEGGPPHDHGRWREIHRQLAPLAACPRLHQPCARPTRCS
jgi:hypothetical protein